MSAARPRLLFVKSRRASFIELDQRLLAEHYDITEIYQPGHFTNPLRTLRQLLAADVLVGWWASWHTFVPFTLAWLLRKGLSARRKNGALGVESALALGERRSLVVVTVEGRRLLLGLAPNHVSLVTELQRTGTFDQALSQATVQGAPQS